ncbi:group II intron reverse transcriptase/maturase [Clostridium frigoris]|nr:group II intron reverse transcriptase/maturase [Clostridium frigoris]
MMKKWYSLIDKVYLIDNLRKAFKAVKSNKGAPGIDGETVEIFEANMEANIVKLNHELKTETYEPLSVRRVYIDKDDGTKRPLGIPTVRDRVVQQALKNILEPIFEPTFHPSSYGYRPNRSCQKAVAKAERFMNKYGLEHVVDMDLSKCFDTLDHEIIIKSVNEKVSDSRILKLVDKFLNAGTMENGIFDESDIGCPQGAVISPLLMNIYLDYFDKAMMEKGIRIVRYADDILIFAKSKELAGKYLALAIHILEKHLKLKVNETKTHIADASKGVAFLGFIIRENWVSIHPKRIEEFKNKIRRLTPRNHGMNIEQILRKLNPVIRGWANYFRIANCKGLFEKLFSWIKRRLRMKKMKEWKSYKSLHKALRRRGYKGEFKKISMVRWRNSNFTLIHMALPNSWFKEIKLVHLSDIQVGVLSNYYE